MPSREAQLCEQVHALARPPGGRFDRVAARRLALCDGADAGGPVVVYLPGMHMNGELPPEALAPDLRRHLARHGIRVWSVDYRTHAVPATATPDVLVALAAWTADVFTEDVEALVALARRTDAGPLHVAGFSYGAGIAYRLAARDDTIAGLVVLDGVPPTAHDTGGDSPAIDLASGRLPWDTRTRLLGAAMADPAAESPVADFPTAGAALAEIVHSARAFGGSGGLSGVKLGTSDVRAVAALLATYDRWWPRAALDGGPVAPPRRKRPVLAFAATNMGPEWLERVRAGARAYGGDAAIVHELPRYGHIDVLVADDADRRVFEPVRRFVTGER